MPEDKRVDDLREDLQELRREMHAGFSSLESKVKESNVDLTAQNKEVNKSQDNDIEKIRRVLKNHEKIMKEIDTKHSDKYNALYDLFTRKINSLDQRLFKLFFVGNIIGMAVGSIVTMIIQVIARNI